MTHRLFKKKSQYSLVITEKFRIIRHRGKQNQVSRNHWKTRRVTRLIEMEPSLASSECCSATAFGMSILAPKWPPNGTNPRLFRFQASRPKCTELWSEKISDLFNMGAIWPNLDAKFDIRELHSFFLRYPSFLLNKQGTYVTLAVAESMWRLGGNRNLGVEVQI